MSDHAETALDQLRNADELCDTAEDEIAVFLAAAQVHATLALADAVRDVAALLMPDHIRVA